MSADTDEPGRVTFEEAWRLLLPSSRAEGIVSDVKPSAPWTRPRPATALDKHITALIERGEVRSRDELNGLGVLCPYVHARQRTVLAVKEAGERAAALKAARIKGVDPDLMAQAKKLRDLATAIEEALPAARQAMMRLMPVRPTQRHSVADANARAAECEAAVPHAQEVVAYLRRAAARATDLKDAINPPHGDGDPWAQAFAERLAYCWDELTGRRPSEGVRDCLDLVEAAYVSLGGSEGSDPWVTPLRRARERIRGMRTKGRTIPGLPEWDRTDRLALEAEPPGGQMHAASELEEAETKKRRRLVSYVLDWADAATPEAKLAAQKILANNGFLVADERRQEEIRQIVANRDAGGDIWAGALRPVYSTKAR